MPGTDAAADLRRAQALLAGSSRVVVLSGAGISTDSGIPDFRGPNGVWTKNPAAEKLSTLQDYLASREIREQTWLSRLHHPAWQAEPNAAHHAVLRLERQHKLHALLTQNIDGLHQKAGSAPELVLELHGTMFETECLDCGARGPMRDTLRRVEAGESDPPCADCTGILKAATISFGQALDETVLRRAAQAARTCDLMLAVGTSLGVHPAAGLVDVALHAGANLVVCNGSETPYDDAADVVLRKGIGQVLPVLVGSTRH